MIVNRKFTLFILLSFLLKTLSNPLQHAKNNKANLLKIIIICYICMYKSMYKFLEIWQKEI